MANSLLKQKMGRFIHAIQTIFQENMWFIAFLFLLNVTTTGWSLLKEHNYDVLLSYSFSMFFASFGVAALVQILYNPILKNLVKILLLLITGSIFIVEFFAMYNYNILIGVGIINSIFETNIREATEFLQMYVGLREIIGVVGILTAIILVKRNHTSFCKFNHAKPNKIVLGALAIGLVYTIRMVTVYTDYFTDNQYLPLQRAYASAQTALKNIEAYNTLSANVNNEIVLTENKGKIKNIVFLLGESTNRNHMSLYGYNLPTTPNLQKLKNSGEIAVFNNVISPHSTTIAVLSKLFTFCDYESTKEWYEYNNLIDIMNSAGYKTFWLSNQESSGIWGNVAQLFAEHSSKHEYTRIRESREDYGIVDGELFPLIDRALAERSDKNFFVIHLMGAHGLYYNRYPYAFTKFHPEDINLAAKDSAKLVVSQYDNAVYYNDYIVNEIINKFRDDETLFVYVSDHGEAVYDESDFAGHIEENPSRHMIEIPMIVWGSEKFRENYPEKMEKIYDSVERPYMTDDLIHTVLDLADIKTAEFDPTRSIVNDDFNAARKRIFKERDYDKEILMGIDHKTN